jgi:hypothetical protein
MAMGYSTTLRNAQMDAKTTTVGAAGKFALYDGTRPATGGAATTKLAEFTPLGTPFAPGAAAGVLSPTIPAATVGLAAGTATWARLTTAAGTFVADYGVATSGSEVTVNTTTISIGVAVTITSWTETCGNP